MIVGGAEFPCPADCFRTNSGMITHSVYFWLKSDAPQGEEAALENGLKELGSIPGIKLLSVGRPAPVPPRPVLEAGYTLALVLETESVDSLAAYQSHPVHTQFLAAHSPHWEKVQVFDVLA